MGIGQFDDVLRPGALTPGTAVLLTGPALSGKREMLLSLLASRAPAERGTVFVTTRRGATSIARELAETGPGVPADRLSVVDCVSRGALGSRGLRNDARNRYVSDPGDLTGIGIGVTEFLRDYRREGVSPWLGVHSLSTMVMYASVRSVFRFLHVIVSRIRSDGGVALVALDDSTVSASDLAVLSQPFDGRLEVREGDGHDEVRARGVGVGPRAWTPIREAAEF